MTQAKRQAVTLHGLATRLSDAQLLKMQDTRSRRGRRLPFEALLLSLMFGMVTACRSLQAVEAMTARLPRRVRRASRIFRRISDTSLRDTLLRLDARQAR